MNSPKFKYRAEARKPGQKSFEFDTVDGETARAMADMHGWELIRVYQPGKDSDRPTAKPSKDTLPLSGKQIAKLAIEAGKAFRIVSKHGLTDLAEDEWRHEQVRAAVKRAGLKECENRHYKKLLNHFRRAQGKSTGFTGSDQQSNEGGDTLEKREQVIFFILHELKSHSVRVNNPGDDARMQEWSATAKSKGGIIGLEYLMIIARRKNPGVTLTDSSYLITLTTAKLEHLLFTIRNRIAAREGRGDADNRNRGQKG